MATTLSTWLVAGEAAPKAFEAKFTKAPKLTTVLNNIATHIPAGPAIYPNPPAGGLPTFDISKIPNPPNIFGAPTVTGTKLATQVKPIQKQGPLPQITNVTQDVTYLARHAAGQVGSTVIEYQ